MKSPSNNREWWDALDAFGKEWKPELQKIAKAKPGGPTDAQLDALLSSTSITLYVFEGGDLDLEPLRRFTRLCDLNVQGFKSVKNTEVLSELASLRSLSLSKDNLADISFLKDLGRLESLDLAQNKIADISVLRGLTRLTKLDLGYNKLTDLDALTPLTALAELGIRVNKIADLSFIRGMTKLETLYANNNKYKDLSPLTGLVNLVRLDVGGPFNAGKVTDLSPLATLSKLETLDVSSNKITDVSPLKACVSLQSLRCEVTSKNMAGFQELLGLKALKSISTHSEIMSKKDRDAFKKARPKVKISLG